MNAILDQVEPIAAGPRRVLRTITAYVLDQWGYVYNSGQRGEDATNRFCFMPGAFDASIARSGDIVLSMDMDGRAFARTGDDTLQIVPDATGLFISATLLDSPLNRALCRIIDGNLIKGWSHRFEADPTGYSVRPVNGGWLTEIHEAELLELTFVGDKTPRQLVRTTPIFIVGGPRQARKPPGETLIKGSCCQTAESGGSVIHVCAEMLASECDSLGGTFLGAGSRCFLEGCSGCATDCNTFCEQYSLHFLLAAPVGCVAFPATDCTSTLTRSAGCNWVNVGDCYPDGLLADSWLFSLDINTATSPPTRTLTATWTDGTDSISITASSMNGFCEAPNVLLTIDSYTSTFCSGDPPSAATILLTQLADCPDFLP